MHMSHKKRASTAFKSMGAAGLAAATIVSGLSFGAPAASAAGVTPQMTKIGSTKMVYKEGSTYYGFADAPGNWGVVGGTAISGSTWESVASRMWPVDIYSNGEYFQMRAPHTSDCLLAEEGVAQFGSSSRTIFRQSVGACYESNSKANWSISPSGKLVSARFNAPVGTKISSNLTPGMQIYGFGGSGYDFPGVREVVEAASRTSLTATAGKVNNIAKTAVVSGVATKDAEVSIGSQKTTATDGTWSITVTGLSNGSNSLVAVQKINGTEFDRKTVPVTIVDGGTIVGVDQGPVDLVRGESTQVPFLLQNNETRSSMVGSATLTAPEGTTFDPGQSTVEVMYRSSPEGDFKPYSRLDLKDGTRSEDGRTMTFTVNTDGGSMLAGEQYRYLLDVTPDEDAAAGSGEMAFVYSGDSSKGDYRATGKTTTTIPVAEAAEIVAMSPTAKAGSTSSTGTAKVQAAEVVGPMTLTAPAGTTFADVSARHVSDDVEQGNYRITYNDDRTAVTVGGPSNGSGAHWGTGHQYVAYTLDVPRTTAAGTITGGAATVKVGDTVLAEGSFGVTVEAADVAALVVTTPEDGSTVDVARPVFSGTGDEGATIEIRDEDDTLIGTTTVTDGTWSVPANTDIADGPHDFVVTQKPLQGESSTAPVSFIVATNPLTTELTADGRFLPDYTKPAEIFGDATTGATVIVRDSLNNEVGRTEAVDGKYVIPVPPSFARPGVNDFTVTQTKDGTTSPAENVSLDYGTPQPIRITSPANGATVNKNGLTFTGTGDEDARIDVRGSVRAIATGTVKDGRWTAPVTVDLSNNVYNLRAVQTTKGGLTTQAPITITITDEAPVAPLTATAAFNATDENLPATMTGTANPGATVTVKTKDGQLVGSTVAINGSYTITIPANKAHFGVNEFTVTQTVKGTVSPALERSLDYGNPAAPVITSPENGATVTNGSIRFTGTGATGAKLDMRGNTSSIGDTKITDGTWTVNVTRQLNPNLYALHALQTSKGGLTQRADITVTVKNEAPVAPLTATAAFNATDENLPATMTGTANPGATVTVKTKDGQLVGSTVAINGSYTITIPANKAHFGVNEFTVTQTVKGTVSPALERSLDYGNPAAPVITSPENGATVTNGSIRFTGIGATGAKLDMRGNTSSIGDTKITDGAWTVDVTRQLNPNLYALHALQTSKGGLTQRADITVVVRNEQITDLTAVGEFPNEVEQEAFITGAAQNGADVIVKEGSTVIESVKAVNSTYTVQVPATVSGERTFTVTQTVKGKESAPKTVTLDYGTPAALSITSPANGGIVPGNQIVFTGTGEPEAKVVLNGTVSRLGSATVNDEGSWSITVDRTLRPQDYTLFTKQITKGNLNGPADQRTITVTQ